MAGFELLPIGQWPRRGERRPGIPAPPPTLVAALAREPRAVARHPALGDFLRCRWADAAFMTAAGMAEATSIPTTTLLRLLGLLGYPSFRAFRNTVRDQLRSR